MAKSVGGGVPQLIACASIYQLERRLEAAGIDASSIWATPDSWDEFGPQLDEWIEEAASALAYASVAAISVIDFEAIVIDGEMPATVRDRLTARTAQFFAALDRRGLSEVEIVSGRNRGRRARDRRRGFAAHQEFRSRPRSSVQGFHEPGELIVKASIATLASPSPVGKLWPRGRGEPSRATTSSLRDQREASWPHASLRSSHSISSSSAARAISPIASFIPALFNRERSDQFSEPTRIIGASRRHLERDAFRASVKDALMKFAGVDDGAGAAMERFPVPTRLRRGRRDERRRMGRI